MLSVVALALHQQSLEVATETTVRLTKPKIGTTLPFLEVINNLLTPVNHRVAYKQFLNQFNKIHTHTHIQIELQAYQYSFSYSCNSSCDLTYFLNCS